jgi:hypothetical protein
MINPINRALFAVLILAIAVSLACAEDLVFCDSVPVQNTEWIHNFSVPKFDPSIGTLNGVDINILFNLSQRIKVENSGGSDAMINSTTNSVLQLITPDSKEIDTNASLIINKTLGPFDGSNDFSGSSGINLTETARSAVTYSYPSVISDFVANGSGEMVQLEAMTNTTPMISVSGSTSSEVLTMADASVCVSYHYDPKSSPSGGF